MKIKLSKGKVVNGKAHKPGAELDVKRQDCVQLLCSGAASPMDDEAKKAVEKYRVQPLKLPASAAKKGGESEKPKR